MLTDVLIEAILRPETDILPLPQANLAQLSSGLGLRPFILATLRFIEPVNWLGVLRGAGQTR